MRRPPANRAAARFNRQMRGNQALHPTPTSKRIGDHLCVGRNWRGRLLFDVLHREAAPWTELSELEAVLMAHLRSEADQNFDRSFVGIELEDWGPQVRMQAEQLQMLRCEGLVQSFLRLPCFDGEAKLAVQDARRCMRVRVRIDASGRP